MKKIKKSNVFMPKSNKGDERVCLAEEGMDKKDKAEVIRNGRKMKQKVL